MMPNILKPIQTGPGRFCPPPPPPRPPPPSITPRSCDSDTWRVGIVHQRMFPLRSATGIDDGLRSVLDLPSWISEFPQN